MEEKNLEEISAYCENLGSTSPVPGGGSAGGIALSLGASCTEKAMRFSKTEISDPDMIERLIETLAGIREKGLSLAREDEKAFLNWQDARRLPKDTPEEKKIRQERINYYLEESIRVPLNLCEYSLKLINTLNDVIKLCNKWLISDACIGALFAKTAFYSGLLNIDINMPFLKNEDLKGKIKKFKDLNINLFDEMFDRIIEFCDGAIGEKG